jgi:pSer/pThr/pTyr-binding forkhead associated (FHA) protein
MSGLGRILGRAIACGIGGALAWVLTLPFFPDDIAAPNWQAVEIAFVLLIVSLIGFGAGLMQGLQRGGRFNIITASLLGLILGTLGGMFGWGMGSSLVQALFRPDVFTSEGYALDRQIARTLAFLPLGVFLGAGVGGAQRSLRGVLSGAVGGAIGGGIAGFIFDPIGASVAQTVLPTQAGNEVGDVSRGVMAASLGIAVGLFTAIFDAATRQAWLRLVLGRNEGREWPIDAAQTLIGRDERAHVPLFADPRLPALAAVISRQNGQYWLQDPGTPIGVGLNGQRIAQAAPLRHGDAVQVGSLQLQFLMRGGARIASGEGRAPAVSVGGQPAPAPRLQPIQAGSAPASAPATAAGALVLAGVSGPLAGQKFVLSGPLEAGREAAGIPMPNDSQASRRHALLTPAPGGVQIQDLGSTNGTFVNGQRAAQALAGPGDAIRIGSSELRVETG